jgi:hypothetical protein
MTKPTEKTSKDDGYDFVIRVIQYLDYTFKIRFFTTTRDFDVLYRWWEKRIPMHIVKESIANVVERRTQKNKKITGFSNFYYEVKKNFQVFLQLNVGGEDREPGSEKTAVAGGEYAEFETFFENYPEDLTALKEDFETLFQKIKNKEDVEPGALHQKLVELFKDDEELNMKVAVFARSLAPELRKPAIENRYRLNYLLNKYRIPDFEII